MGWGLAFSCAETNAPDPNIALLFEQLDQVQIDCVAHRLVPRVVRVQVISAVVGRQGECGIRRVACHRVEVDDGIEYTTRADPVVSEYSIDTAHAAWR